MVAVKLDADEVIAATSNTLKRIGSLTGFSQRQVLIGFAGVVLKQWAGWTKVSTVERASLRARGKATRDLGYSGYNGGMGTRKADHPITINSGKRGEVGRVFILKKDGHGFRRTHNANFQPINRHYSDAQWRDIQEAVQDTRSRWNRDVPLAKKSVGMARQSVVQIADSLGIDIATVKGGGSLSSAGIYKARAALASNGKSYRNGTSAQGGNSSYDYVDLINTLPGGSSARLGMDRTLIRVLNGQNKYFEQSYAKGAFDSQAKACKAYPNLFTFSSSN